MARCSQCGRRWVGTHARCTVPTAEQTEIHTHATVPRIDGYHLEQPLGRGGFADVYACTRDSDGHQFAIKIARADQPESQACLEKELAALRAIGPPTCPTVYAEGTLPEGTRFGVIERISAPTLGDVLESTESGFPWPEAVAITRALLAAIDVVHAKGFVHRDLKPENIFIIGARINPIVRLIDFGLASTSSGAPHSEQAALAGTPEYMSPEQSEGLPEAFQVGADLYSVGVLLYELLTARPPFWGTTTEVKQAHQSKRPPVPSQLAPVPRPIEDVVLTALAKTPAERFANVAAFQKALEQAVEKVSAVDPVHLTPSVAAATSPASQKKVMAVLFFESKAELTKVRSTVAAMAGEILSVAGQRFIVGFGEQAAENPTKRAIRAAERLSHEGISRQLRLTLGRVTVQTRPDGTRRVSSPMLFDATLFPLAIEPLGLLLTEEAAATAPELVVEPVKDRPGVFCHQFGTLEAESTVVRRAAAPFFGRETLLNALRAEAAAALVTPAPAISVIVGEPGTGKSRVLATLGEQLMGELGLKTLHVRAREPVAGEPTESLRLLLGLVLSVTPKPDARWEQTMAASRLGASLPRDEQLAAALVMGWASHELPEVRPLAAAPGVLSRLASRAAGEGLRRMAGEQGLCVLFDDAHLADQETLAALKYAVLPVAKARLWVCATVRPGFSVRLLTEAPPRPLEPLTDADAAAFCRALLAPVTHVPDEAINRLVQRTRGVPQLMVELVNRLKRDGLVRKHGKGDAWYLATDELELITSMPVLEWVAERELSALPPDLMAHARLAALLGADFWPSSLEGVLRELEHDGLGHEFPLDAQVGLRRLAQADVVLRHRDGRMSFRTALLREAIVNATPEALKLKVFTAAARFFRQESSAPADARLPRLAGYLERAGQKAEAAELYFTLGQKLRHRHAYIDAEGMYSRAITLLPQELQAPRLAALRGRGVMRYRQARHEEALRDFRQAAELAQQLGDLRAHVEVLLDEATALDWTGDFWHAKERSEQARALAAPLNDPLITASLTMAGARVLFRQSDYAGACREYERAAAMATQLGDEAYEILIASLMLLAPLLVMLGRPDDSLAEYERAVALVTEHSDRSHHGVVLNNRQMLWQQRRDGQRALQDVQGSLELGREMGSVDMELTAYGNLGELSYQLDDLEAAHTNALRAYEMAKQVGGDTDPRLSSMLLLLGRVHLYRGQFTAARARMEEVRAIQERLKSNASDLIPCEESFARMLDIATRPSTDAEWDALETFSREFGVQQDPVEVIEARALWAAREEKVADGITCMKRALALAATIPNLMEPRLKKALARLEAAASA